MGRRGKLRQGGKEQEALQSQGDSVDELGTCSGDAGLPDGPVAKSLPASAEDTGSIPGLERSVGGGNDNTFQYSCLENPMDGGAWWATVHGVAKSWT